MQINHPRDNGEQLVHQRQRVHGAGAAGREGGGVHRAAVPGVQHAGQQGGPVLRLQLRENREPVRQPAVSLSFNA